MPAVVRISDTSTWPDAGRYRPPAGGDDDGEAPFADPTPLPWSVSADHIRLRIPVLQVACVALPIVANSVTGGNMRPGVDMKVNVEIDCNALEAAVFSDYRTCSRCRRR